MAGDRAKQAATQRKIGDMKWEAAKMIAPYIVANLQNPLPYLPDPRTGFREMVYPVNLGIEAQDRIAQGARVETSDLDNYDNSMANRW